MADEKVVNKQFRKDYEMTGEQFHVIQIPVGMNYVTILNGTPNSVELYDFITNQTAVPIDSIAQTLPNYNQTMPLRKSLVYTVVWRDGGGTQAKKLSLIFTTESLQINGFTGAGGASQEVIIGTDNIGLTRRSQLPTSLTPSGNLAVEIKNVSVPISVVGEMEIKNDIGNPIPVALPAIPNGTNNIGTVGVSGLPLLPQLPLALSPDGNLKVDLQNSSLPLLPQLPLALTTEGDLKVSLQNINPIPVVIDQVTTSNSVIKKITVLTATITKLSSVPFPCKAVLIQSSMTNTDTIFIGISGSSRVFELAVGASVVIPTDDLMSIAVESVSQTTSYVNLIVEV